MELVERLYSINEIQKADFLEALENNKCKETGTPLNGYLQSNGSPPLKIFNLSS